MPTLGCLGLGGREGAERLNVCFQIAVIVLSVVITSAAVAVCGMLIFARPDQIAAAVLPQILAHAAVKDAVNGLVVEMLAEPAVQDSVVALVQDQIGSILCAADPAQDAVTGACADDRVMREIGKLVKMMKVQVGTSGAVDAGHASSLRLASNPAYIASGVALCYGEDTSKCKDGGPLHTHTCMGAAGACTPPYVAMWTNALVYTCCKKVYY